MQEDVTSNIINHLFSNGFGWGMFGLFLFGFFWAVYKKILSNEKIQDAIAFWFTSKIYKVSIKDIKKHRIFSDKLKLKNKVDLLSFKGEALKTKVFRLLFTVKLSIDTQKLNEFTKLDFKDISKEELHIKMCDTVESMKQSFNETVKTELVKFCEKELSAKAGDNYNQSHAETCASKILNYVMYEPKGFDEYRALRIESLLFDIELIRDSPIYDNNNERVYQFLSTVGHSIEKAIMRAAKIFEDFNGEIENIFNAYKENN